MLNDYTSRYILISQRIYSRCRFNNSADALDNIFEVEVVKPTKTYVSSNFQTFS